MCVLREFQGWNKAALFHYLPSGRGAIRFYSSSYLKNKTKKTPHHYKGIAPAPLPPKAEMLTCVPTPGAPFPRDMRGCSRVL